MNKIKTKSERKFTALAKTGYDHTLKQDIFVKYRFNNIDNFLQFIQKKHNPLYINIYDRIGVNAGKLRYTWGRTKGLQQAY